MAEVARTGLVVSAHSADFVWRAAEPSRCMPDEAHGEGGLPVLRRARRVGQAVAQPGMTLERVKQDRRTRRARGGIAGREIEFLDVGDYPMRCPILRSIGWQTSIANSGRNSCCRIRSRTRTTSITRWPRTSRRKPASSLRPTATPRRNRARRAASVPVRAAPDRAMQLEAAGAARHHAEVWDLKRKHSN